MRCSPTLLPVLLIVLLLARNVFGSDQPSAERGYQLLTRKPYLPADFDQETFDALWTVWPEQLRKAAESATQDERRQLAFSRYGLTARPDDPSKPLQYVVDDHGQWTMNCFSCHGGKVRGIPHPGLPNSLYALATLTDDVRKVKVKLGKKPTRMEVGSLFIPLGKSNGTTNAVMFGVALMAFRDAHLQLQPRDRAPKMVHHDMDAPAWWHFKRKSHLYIDGFAGKGHRALMQFMLVEENGPEDFRRWESEFRDVFAYIASIEPPRYPFAIDRNLAAQGARVFEESCARCHGTYGSSASYPETLVPLDEIGTDPVRLTALTRENRQAYHKSWFNHFGDRPTEVEPEGYVAPPLDGVWASAPYFHNGSVPTLWHVLHPDQRPAIWKRDENGFDEEHVGLQVETFDKLPKSIRRSDELRTYFNTNRFGKSAAGHNFPDELSAAEKRSLLEYLKTL